MDVYVLTNQALHADSSYYEVLGVYDTFEKACGALGTALHDTIKFAENGEYGEEWKSAKIVEEGPYEDGKGYAKITTAGDSFEEFEITKHQLH